MYPSEMRQAETRQGDWLRTMMRIACACHCIFFVVGLALVGFFTMIMNLGLAALSYSAHLTLKEPIVILYFFCLLAGMSYNFNETLMGRVGTTSYMQMGVVANLALFCSILFFGGKAYYYFREAGGIKGTDSTRKKDSVLNKAATLANKVGD